MQGRYLFIPNVWGCGITEHMPKHNAIKMEMIDQIGDAALTQNISYMEKIYQSGASQPLAGVILLACILDSSLSH